MNNKTNQATPGSNAAYHVMSTAHDHRENEAKVAMVEAITRSQIALARLLEQLADVSAHSEVQVKLMYDNIHLLSQHQHALCHMVTGWRPRSLNKGTPEIPWLNPVCHVEIYGPQGSAGGEAH
ncbi:hypothetical protein [Paenibacillus sp. UMB4589-SE434]|uniref:hypothetical protein n=1 Tax=Paenibacillus sp. UMB4589-SE434 TaxID=3046314 RepID=UPI00254D88F5|nr:hypothetical protein [Paenibacillus sp. UMB4589-SE434]MDK8183648.1 hypothetical protein [Paenibacillus sp. UMB4589-SE434]